MNAEAGQTGYSVFPYKAHMNQQRNYKNDSMSRFAIVILMLITLICLLPFIDKAAHIDDPVYIWVAQHIQVDPYDPYGFSVTWYDSPLSMHEVTQNPPLSSYYMALTAFLVGWSERALHSVFILPAILFIIGTYLLAGYFCSRPFDAALITLLTPVVLLSSTTLMCDIMMLCFWVWATYLWLKGVLNKNKLLLVIAAVLVGCAALTKYYGMSLILLLLIWTLARKRRVDLSLLMLLIPVAMLAAYQWITAVLYGKGLLFAAAAYASQVKNTIGQTFSTKSLIGIAYSGGCLFTVIFYINKLWNKSWLMIQGVITLAIAILIVYVGVVGNVTLNGPDGLRLVFIIQFSLFTLAGISLLAITIGDILHHKDANSLLLALWFFGTLYFAIQINWSISGRALLPIAPVMGILVVRRIEMLSEPSFASSPPTKSKAMKPENRSIVPSSKMSFGQYIPLIPAAVLSLLVTYADYDLANTIRQDAENISRRYQSASNTVWLQGHWGFQYYMESHGCKPFDIKNPSFVPDDIIVQPLNNTNLSKLDSSVTTQREVYEDSALPWLSCMNYDAGAGFYSDQWGPIPFVFGSIPPEQYIINVAHSAKRPQ